MPARCSAAAQFSPSGNSRRRHAAWRYAAARRRSSRAPARGVRRRAAAARLERPGAGKRASSRGGTVHGESPAPPRHLVEAAQHGIDIAISVRKRPRSMVENTSRLRMTPLCQRSPSSVFVHARAFKHDPKSGNRAHSAAAGRAPVSQVSRSPSARAQSARFLATLCRARAAACRRCRASAAMRAAGTGRNSRSSAGTSAGRHRWSRYGRR